MSIQEQECECCQYIGGDQDGAYKADGNINTKYIPNWWPL